MEKQKKYKILIAEDDIFLSRALKETLAREGFDVMAAFTGKEIWSKIKEEKPDIVLLDLMLPDKNGFEILKDMKLNDAYKDISVLILTNLGQDTDIKKGLDLGADDYIIKSNFTLHAIIEKVKEILVKRKKKEAEDK